MIDVNTTAAALNNAAGIQALMNPQANQDINRAALANTFQRGNMLLQNQLEAQRQAALLSAESARQTQSERAAAALEGVRQAGETSRQGSALSAESARQSAAISGQRETELAVESKREQSEVDLRNTAEAERIRADPLTPQLGIDPSKYDARKPEDNAKLVNDYQAAKTPDAMRKIFTDNSARLTDALSSAKGQLAQAIQGPEAQRAQVMSLLADTGVTTALLQSYNTIPGSFSKLSMSDLDAIRQQVMSDPKGAMTKLSGWMQSATQGAIMGHNDPSIIGVMNTAKQTAYQQLLDPTTAPPSIRSLYQTTADLSALRNNNLSQLGQYSPKPEDIARATGNQPGGPVTDMLAGKGAGVSPTGSSLAPAKSSPNPISGLQQPDISKIPASPGELPTTGLDSQSAAIVNQRNLQIRQQNYDAHITQPLQQISSQRQQLQQQIARVKSDPNYGAYSVQSIPGLPPQQGQSQQAETLSQLGQQDAALAAKQAEIQSHQAAFASVASGQGMPAGYGQQGQNPQASIASPVQQQIGVNPYQSNLSQFMQNAAYGSPNN